MMNIHSNKIKSNIFLYYITSTILNMIFFIPVFQVYLKENGLSLTQIGILQSIFALIIIIMEIPSGYFSDIYGRKKSYILGGLGLLLGVTMYSSGHVFWEFVVGEILWGIGISFISGTDSALLYDSLLEMKKEKKYGKYEGRNFFFSRIGALFATIIGGIIAVYNIRLTLKIMILTYSINLILMFFIKEPQKHKKLIKANYLSNFIKILKEVSHTDLKWIVLFSGFAAGFGNVWFIFLQPLMIELKIPIIYFGWVFGVLGVIAASTAFNSYKIEKKIGKKNAVLIITIFTSIPILLVGLIFNKAILLILLFAEIAWAFSLPTTKAYINNRVSSEKRATILSIASFFSYGVNAVFMPIVGFIGDISMKFSYIILGVVSILLLGSLIPKVIK